MIRYHNADVVFSEVPDETTLAVNITGCPNRCPGCHSPHLMEETGRELDRAELETLLGRYGRSVTCVCFMGGDADPRGVVRLAGIVRESFPVLRTAWYSGRPDLPEGFGPKEVKSFDYIKLGGYVAELGPLTSPSTNQRFYRVSPDGALQDITFRFRNRPVPFPE